MITNESRPRRAASETSPGRREVAASIARTPDAGGVVAADEVDLLRADEAIIEAGLATFVDVGQALARIRDGRRYRLEGFDTFEGYCRERWGFSRVRAHQMIEAAQVSEALTIVNAPQITNEGQAREVAAIIKSDGPEAWPGDVRGWLRAVEG